MDYSSKYLPARYVYFTRFANTSAALGQNGPFGEDTFKRISLNQDLKEKIISAQNIIDPHTTTSNSYAMISYQNYQLNNS